MAGIAKQNSQHFLVSRRYPQHGNRVIEGSSQFPLGSQPGNLFLNVIASINSKTCLALGKVQSCRCLVCNGLADQLHQLLFQFLDVGVHLPCVYLGNIVHGLTIQSDFRSTMRMRTIQQQPGPGQLVFLGNPITNRLGQVTRDYQQVHRHQHDA